MALTTKELMLLEDNIKSTQNSITFMQGCQQIATDPQVKGLCQQMITEHQENVQVFMKHINPTNMQ